MSDLPQTSKFTDTDRQSDQNYSAVIRSDAIDPQSRVGNSTITAVAELRKQRQKEGRLSIDDYTQQRATTRH